MTALIVLGSVAAYVLCWLMTARARVSAWHARGDSILKDSQLFVTRRFDRQRDRPWIAWYALLVTFLWPLTAPVFVAGRFVFRGVDRRVRLERERVERRNQEVNDWRRILELAPTN